MDMRELPVGFGMALSQNLDSLDYFAALPLERQRLIVEEAGKVTSSEGMRDFVLDLTKL